jgi:hypothetical protein
MRDEGVSDRLERALGRHGRLDVAGGEEGDGH